MSSVLIDGLRFPSVFSEEAVLSAQKYAPRSDDVLVATYPKCGTTWTQVILGLVFAQGDKDGGSRLLHSSPFLELKGAGAAETMPRPGIIKTHLPFNRAPWSDKAKYIYVARNPKDCCVSYYYHHLVHQAELTFDEFFDLFLKGDVNFGDYFDHLMGWYEQRNRPNILFITYEEMKQNTKETIFKMASFIDDQKYAEPLREDSEKLNNIIKFSSLDHIKGIINKNDEEESKKHGSTHNSSSGKMHGHHENKLLQPHCGHGTKNMDDFLVRKGIIGDWRNHFSEEQSKRMDAKFAEKVKDTEINYLWKDYL